MESENKNFCNIESDCDGLEIEAELISASSDAEEIERVASNPTRETFEGFEAFKKAFEIQSTLLRKKDIAGISEGLSSSPPEEQTIQWLLHLFAAAADSLVSGVDKAKSPFEDSAALNEFVLLATERLPQSLPSVSTEPGDLLQSYLKTLLHIISKKSTDDDKEFLVFALQKVERLLGDGAVFSSRPCGDAPEGLVSQMFRLWSLKDAEIVSLSFAVAKAAISFWKSANSSLYRKAIKAAHTAFSRNSVFYNSKNRLLVEVMTDHLSALFAIDTEVSYEYSFVFIRVLAKDLHEGAKRTKTAGQGPPATSKKPARSEFLSARGIVSFQFINRLALWGRILAEQAVDADGPKKPYCHLVYPLVSIVLGALTIHCSPNIFPFSIHVLQTALRLLRAARGRISVPLVPFIVPLIKAFSKKNVKAPENKERSDLRFVVALKNCEVKKSLDDFLVVGVELLKEYFTIHSQSIWFVPHHTHLECHRLSVAIFSTSKVVLSVPPSRVVPISPPTRHLPVKLPGNGGSSGSVAAQRGEEHKSGGIWQKGGRLRKVVRRPVKLGARETQRGPQRARRLLGWQAQLSGREGCKPAGACKRGRFRIGCE